MKSVSIKKFSLLGLMLVSASAIIAAVLPSKENKDAIQGAPTLQNSTGDDNGQQTCVMTAIPDPNDLCNESTTTNTTSPAGNGTSVSSPGPFEDSTSTDRPDEVDANQSFNNTNLND